DRRYVAAARRRCRADAPAIRARPGAASQARVETAREYSPVPRGARCARTLADSGPARRCDRQWKGPIGDPGAAGFPGLPCAPSLGRKRPCTRPPFFDSTRETPLVRLTTRRSPRSTFLPCVIT